MCITELLCCTAEINTTLQIDYTSTFKNAINKPTPNKKPRQKIRLDFGLLGKNV